MEHRSCTWVFTINNYTEEDIKRLEGLDVDAYFTVFGEEVGEQGTPHLQGYIRAEKRLRRANIEKVLGGRAWCAVTHNETAAIGYCLKDGRVHSNEELPAGLGERAHMAYVVCKEMGMKKYLYEVVGHLAFEEVTTWSGEDEARVCAGYCAWLEGIKWWDRETWKGEEKKEEEDKEQPEDELKRIIEEEF